MLRLEASPQELAGLGDVLRRIARKDELAFSSLFDPLGARTPVLLESREMIATLRHFGLVEGDDAVVGTRRLRRYGERFYVLEVGERHEYRQDVWPETDALLAVLERAAAGSLLDMGTGSGIVAVEGAARGHRVVATDLYESALALARFNAALNGVADRIDFRRGHLFEPVAAPSVETFDLILTAPHYTRVNDQLRLEALRTGPRHVAPGGRLVVATNLEWEGEDGPLAAVEALLGPLAAAGASVTVEPLFSLLKREWFTVARPSGTPIPGLVSRHRFLVTVEPGGGRLEVMRPELEDQPAHWFVPLARLRLGAEGGASGDAGPPPRRTRAVVTTAEDVARLRQLLGQIAGGVVTMSGPLPSALLDGCRFGARLCVSLSGTDGAAGAILDASGGVRPCAHGDVIARPDETMATVLERLRRLSGEAFARRGCGTCSALPFCSRCLYPTPLDEASYCELMRAEAAPLHALHRLVDTLAFLARSGTLGSSLLLKLHAAAELVVARGRPAVADGEGETVDPEQAAAVAALAHRWREREAWLASDGARHAILWRRDEQLFGEGVGDSTAELCELLVEGASAAQLERYRQERAFPPFAVTRMLRRVGELLADSPLGAK